MAEPDKPAEQGALSRFISDVKSKVVNSTYYQGTIGLLQEDNAIATKELPAKEQQITGTPPAQSAPPPPARPAVQKPPGR